MCSALQEETLKKAWLKAQAAASEAQASGWNGLFSEFTAVSYKDQVVAGVNYFVKAFD